MLSLQPSKRYTAYQALNHPVVKQGSSEIPPTFEGDLVNFDNSLKLHRVPL